MEDGAGVVEVSRAALVVFTVLGLGWGAAVLALVDAIRRRATGDEAAGTWVVFLGTSLLVAPLAAFVAAAYAAVVLRSPARHDEVVVVDGVGEIAGVWPRCWAAAIDAALVLFPLGSLALRVSTIDVAAGTVDVPAWLPWFGWVLSTGYHVVAVAVWGRTVGKKALGLAVVRPGGARPSLPAAGLRAVPMLVGRVPHIGFIGSVAYLPCLWREDRRGLHDQLAGTFVVRVPDARPARGQWAVAAGLTVALVVMAVALVALARPDQDESAMVVVGERASVGLWDDGRPHAEHMAVARSIVDDCLGPAAETGEAVYQYTAMAIQDVRTLAGAAGLEVRVVGEDDRCRPELAGDTGERERLNVYVVDGRVVWARIF